MCVCVCGIRWDNYDTHTHSPNSSPLAVRPINTHESFVLLHFTSAFLGSFFVCACLVFFLISEFLCFLRLGIFLGSSSPPKCAVLLLSVNVGFIVRFFCFLCSCRVPLPHHCHNHQCPPCLSDVPKCRPASNKRSWVPPTAPRTGCVAFWISCRPRATLRRAPARPPRIPSSRSSTGYF